MAIATRRPGQRPRASRGAGRRRAPHRRRRVLRAFGAVLAVAGVLLIADAVLTVVWKEPLTSYLAQRRQDALARDLDRLRAARLTEAQRAALGTLAGDRRRIAYLAGEERRASRPGDAIGRIRIPKIGASYVVVDGTDPADLRKGPGLYTGRPFPGEPGTTAIAGHRTTYLAPFRNLDDLDPGDRIRVEMPYATFTYRVQQRKIVQPDDVGILARQPYDRLVLTACHPLFSAAQRIVVLARLERSDPAGALASVGRPASGIKPTAPAIR
jgi:sortase A